MRKIAATIMSLLLLFTTAAFSACTESSEDKIYLTNWSAGEISDGITLYAEGDKTTVSFVSTGSNSDASVISATTEKISYPYINVRMAADRFINLQVRLTYYDKSGEFINGTATLSVDVEETDYVIYLSEYGKLLSMSLFPLKLSDAAGKLTVGIPYASDYYYGGDIAICTYDKEFTREPVEDEDLDENEGKPSLPGGWDGVIVDDCPVPDGERLYKRYTDLFEIGMTVGYDRYQSYADIAGHYSSMTCENEMKAYTIAPGDAFDYKNPAAYDFSKADEILTYMRKRGKKIRGHALVWYYECPGWLKNETDKAALLDKIDTYCYTVVKHFSENFGDVIYAWDVVNEAVSDNYNGGGAVSQTVKTVFGNNEDGCNGMRNDFYSVAGYDFITTAFKAARRADPNVKLFYNDYNICSEIQKCRGVVDLVAKLIEAGAPIDGVGLQSHFKSMGNNSVTSAENAIKYMIKLGEVTGHPLDIHITELDVENYQNNDTSLAEFYGNLFALYRKYSANISSVTFWAVADDYSWLDHGQYNMAHPMLFDQSHKKKPAFDAVYQFN